MNINFKNISPTRGLEIASVVVIAAAVGFAGWQIFTGPKGAPGVSPVDTSSQEAMPVFEDIVRNRPLADTSAFREIFAPEVQVVAQPQGGQDFSNVMWPSELRIVGLIMGNPSEVIFENSQTRESFYVEEGDQHENIKVLKVSQTGVEVNYQGKTMTLDVGQ